MNCPKCKTNLYVASPYIINSACYGSSSNGDPNEVIKSGKNMTQICVKCNIQFTITQEFENTTLVKEKIEWELFKEQLIPRSGTNAFWARWEHFKKTKNRKEKLLKINQIR